MFRPENASCRKCVYFINIPMDENGQCRRFPPTPILVPIHKDARYPHDLKVNQIFGEWPEVNPMGWCGEFYPKEREE